MFTSQSAGKLEGTSVKCGNTLIQMTYTLRAILCVDIQSTAVSTIKVTGRIIEFIMTFPISNFPGTCSITTLRSENYMLILVMNLIGI